MSTITETPITDYEAAVGDDGQLIDVREPDEFTTGSLPGAINIPLATVPDRLDDIDRARPVVVFCRSGGRSMQAAAYLADRGFDVTNLAGGMLAYD